VNYGNSKLDIRRLEGCFTVNGRNLNAILRRGKQRNPFVLKCGGGYMAIGYQQLMEFIVKDVSKRTGIILNMQSSILTSLTGRGRDYAVNANTK
jgi:hypothetical protein